MALVALIEVIVGPTGSFVIEMHQLGDVVGTLSILEVIVSKVVLLGRYGGILLHTAVLVLFEFFA